MTNNTATLIYHLGKSANEKLGAIDTKIYGPIKTTEIVAQPPENHLTFKDAAYGIGALICFMLWAFIWLNRVDKVKERIFR